MYMYAIELLQDQAKNMIFNKSELAKLDTLDNTQLKVYLYYLLQMEILEHGLVLSFCFCLYSTLIIPVRSHGVCSLLNKETLLERI